MCGRIHATLESRLCSISREQERRGRLCNEVCKQGRSSIRNGVCHDEFSILVMISFSTRLSEMNLLISMFEVVYREYVCQL